MHTKVTSDIHITRVGLVVRLVLGTLFLSPRKVTSVWEAKVSPRRDETSYMFQSLAIAAIHNFDRSCEADGIAPCQRLPKLVTEWRSLVKEYRTTAQELVGPLGPADAVSRLLGEVWWVYGYVSITELDVVKALTDVVATSNSNGKWVDPYAGTGYFAMCIGNALGITVQAWDRKPRHKQWLPVLKANATTADYSQIDVFVLSYPCCMRDCWAGLKTFTRQGLGRHVVFLGEPQGHYCHSDEMWEYLCRHWNLVTSQPIENGMPGGYHAIFVFERHSQKKDVGSVERTGRCGDAFKDHRHTTWSEIIAV